MIVKWIVCEISEGKRVAFSQAQEGWSSLRDVPGFLGQLGGWDLRSPHSACILAFWRDSASYLAFMANVHDDIAPERHYDGVEVSLYEPLFDLPERYPTILTTLGEGGFLRVADCNVRSGRQEHFVEVQANVWKPGMEQAHGMLGGVFSRSPDDARRYLVATLWRDEDAHETYVRDDLPSLRTTASVDDDVDAMIGHVVKLEPSWRVLPT